MPDEPPSINPADCPGLARFRPPTRGPLGAIGPHDLVAVGPARGWCVARLRLSGRRLALRRLPATAARGPAARCALERRLADASRLDHPGFARLVGFEIRDGVPWVAATPVDGVALPTWARAAGRTLGEVRAAFARVCHAVQAAHDRGVAALDLRAAEVVVDGDGCPRLFGFGLGDGSSRDARDPRADVAALGAILGELLRAVAERGRQVPPRLSAAVAASRAADADPRFDNPTALAAAVERHRTARVPVRRGALVALGLVGGCAALALLGPGEPRARLVEPAAASVAVAAQARAARRDARDPSSPAEATPDPLDRAAELEARALALWKTHRPAAFDQAEQLLRRALVLRADDCRTRRLLASMLIERGRYDAAEGELAAVFTALSRSAPLSEEQAILRARCRYDLGVLLDRRGDVGEAVSVIRASLDEIRRCLGVHAATDAQWRLASLLFERGDAAEAVLAAHAALELSARAGAGDGHDPALWPLDFVGIAGEPPDPRPYREAVSAGLERGFNGSLAERVRRLRTLQELLVADGRASQARSLDSLVYDEITEPAPEPPEPSESDWPFVPWP